MPRAVESLWDIMQRYQIDKLTDLLAGLWMGSGVGIAKMPREDGQDVQLTFYQSIKDRIAEIGLSVSIHQIDRMIVRCSEGKHDSPKAIRDDFSVLETVVTDELMSIHFLALDSSEAAQFEVGSRLWGEAVVSAFPSLHYEIEEAAKCSALGRSTASAFHAIRCLEAGIAALSRCLGVPEPTKGAERSWMKMLGALKAEMDRRWNSTARMSGDGQFFEQAHAALASIQNPWRNGTMHLDQKYTEEEAADILAVVGGFMRTLAKRMDENGLPLA